MEEKMKKFLIVLLVLTSLVGCSNKGLDSEKKNEVELNPEEIMAGNFSSISGEYINSEGKIIILNENGLNDNERQTSEVHGSLENGFFMGIHPKTEGDGGYLLMVFPKGVEIPNLEGLTDLTKVRICYGQADPMHIDEIFNKK